MVNGLKKKAPVLLLTLIGIAVINFFLFHLSPGDPTNRYFSPTYDPTHADVLREQMGLDQPWYVQFWTWAKSALSGDLGYSWAKHRPVSHVLGEAIPATLQLTVISLFLNMILGCLGGLFAAVRQDRLSGKILDFTALTLYAMPPFWLALLLIYLFSFKFNILPPSGMQSFGLENSHWMETFLDRLRHLILPALVLGLVGASATFRIVRSNVQKVLQETFVLCARAKGLPSHRIYVNYALRNALVPVVTLLGLYLPLLLSGAFIIEVVFAWPGLGRIAYDAVLAKDLPVLMAVNMIVAVLVVLGNTMSDLLYGFVDPRVRME